MERDTLIERMIMWGPFAIIVLVAIGALIHPDLFWDRFIWKFFWGPIVADAGGDSKGITAEYNIVDTVTYGLILAWAAYLIHRRFRRSDLRVGTPFFLALTPAMIFGPAARALEDMELFNEPVQYIFISPLIYIFLGITTLVLILVSVRIEKVGGRGARIAGFTLVLLPGILLSFVLEAFPGWFNADIPAWSVLIVSLATAALFGAFARRTRYESLVGLSWGSVLLMTVIVYSLWFRDGGWQDHYMEMTGSDPGSIEWTGGGLIIGLTLLSTAIVVISVHLSGRRWKKLLGLATVVNGTIVGGHMLDASATFIGVDRYGYQEKHVLPSNLMGLFGTAAVMFPLKLVFLLPALYFIDVSMREEGEDNVHLVALVKLAILVLGYGPGTRDLLRLMFGV